MTTEKAPCEVHGCTPTAHQCNLNTTPDYVVLPRDALLEFFGKMALPPWIDEKGRMIGGRMNCAVIASEITEWIDAHDLTEVFGVQ